RSGPRADSETAGGRAEEVIVADTSVWIDHFRRHNAAFAARLDAGEIAIHESVIGELACGGLRHRAHVLQLLRSLFTVTSASFDEVMHLIDRRKLMGRGIGWTDAQILAGCMLGQARLWTLDVRLARIAEFLGVGVA
ncbi:MAG TPA: type II toxin-antitoxin system VapC family toxin, partial [Gemmatimonadaceae bacterium]|nr:type II toxin-antitoxin system VapC family toxin [Gemmatimonadaceae bacterium]